MGEHSKGQYSGFLVLFIEKETPIRGISLDRPAASRYNIDPLARVAELADAPGLGPGIFGCAGSSPVPRMNRKTPDPNRGFFYIAYLP